MNLESEDSKDLLDVPNDICKFNTTSSQQAKIIIHSFAYLS